MATVETDPLCGQSHPIKVSQGGKEFYYCAEGHTTVWLTSPLVRQRVLENGGSTRPAPRRANPEEHVIEGGRGRENKPNSSNYITCPKCNSGVVQGQDRCHECGVLLEWDQWRETNPAPTKKPKKSYKIDPDLGF